jgi:hypothetical protein
LGEGYIAEQQSTIDNYQVIMEQLRSGDPNVIHEAEYQRLVGEVAEMQENIRYISMKLAENENATKVRLMKVKDMVLQQAHDFKYPS